MPPSSSRVRSAPLQRLAARRPWTREEVRALLAWVVLALGLAALAALVASLVWSPAELAAGAPQALLGLEARPCPGCALCGLSRAFALVSRGALGEALERNPLVVAAYPAALALGAAVPLALRALCKQRGAECAS